MEKTLKPTPDENLLTVFLFSSSIFLLQNRFQKKKLLDYPYHWDDESPDE